MLPLRDPAKTRSVLLQDLATMQCAMCIVFGGSRRGMLRVFVRSRKNTVLVFARSRKHTYYVFAGSRKHIVCLSTRPRKGGRQQTLQ